MRPDLPYLAGGVVLGGFLLGNAAVAPGAGPVGVLDVVLVAVMAAAVAVCRRHPVPALTVVAATMLTLHVRVHAGVSASFAVLATVYVAAWRGRRAAAALTSLVFLGGFLAYDISIAPEGSPGQQTVERTTLLLGWFVAANVAGLVARQRRAYLEQVEQRAADAERTREEVALRRAGEERLRIARDLHDSLTHSISVIKVQAGIAVHLARKRGEEPPPALLAIQEAGTAAMRELRETLELLRAPSAPDRAGLDRLHELAARTRAAGVPVEVTVTGEPAEVPPDVDEAAYRVVQEALTNVARHAGPASAGVLVVCAPDCLTVSVTDDGHAYADRPITPGVGLKGMHERVAGLGGTLRAAHRADGGFAVRATFPLPARTRGTTVLQGPAALGNDTVSAAAPMGPGAPGNDTVSAAAPTDPAAPGNDERVAAESKAEAENSTRPASGRTSGAEPKVEEGDAAARAGARSGAAVQNGGRSSAATQGGERSAAAQGGERIGAAPESRERRAGAQERGASGGAAPHGGTSRQRASDDNGFAAPALESDRTPLDGAA